MRPGRFFAEATDLVFLVRLEVALEPFDTAVTFEGKDVRRETIEEEAVVADDHGATGEIFDRFLERTQRFDVEVVGRLVEQQHIAAAFQHLRNIHAIAFTTRQLADVFLLVLALEVEGADIGARRLIVTVDLHIIEAVRDFLQTFFELSRWSRLWST